LIVDRVRRSTLASEHWQRRREHQSEGDGGTKTTKGPRSRHEEQL
jgi:hypothetical protein